MDKLAISSRVDIELLCGDADDNAVLNSRIVTVLKEIDRVGSVNKATKNLNMGYSHTLYAIDGIEKALGASIVKRVRPRGSTLTEEGRWLIALFEDTSSRIQGFAEQIEQSNILSDNNEMRDSSRFD